jgi:hypothetical protein
MAIPSVRKNGGMNEMQTNESGYIRIERETTAYEQFSDLTRLARMIYKLDRPRERPLMQEDIDAVEITKGNGAKINLIGKSEKSTRTLDEIIESHGSKGYSQSEDMMPADMWYAQWGQTYDSFTAAWA